MGEVRDFKMHQKLLADVITRQAGSLEKAVLEGVMNSIEAGAKKIDVQLCGNYLGISDDGKGFQSREEIEKWFETFGTPHEVSEGKRWAQFRMGRGQLFAFGRNEWQTNRWSMKVDVHKHLGYELSELPKAHKGCAISVELYEPASESMISYTAKQIERQVKYTGALISVNGVTVGRDPASEKWGPETNDDAYIRLGVGRGLEVYNLGVYVCDLSESRFGVTGVVVSKKQLKVNFARNDICSDCSVWNRVKKLFKSESQMDALLKKRNLSDGERANLVERLVSGELTLDQVWKSPLLVDVCGHTHSFYSLHHYRSRWPAWSYTRADSKDLRADNLIQTKRCLVLDRECVEEFQHAIGDLSKLFSHKWPGGGFNHALAANIPYVPYEKVAETVDNKHEILPESEWTTHEYLWVEILSNFKYCLHSVSFAKGVIENLYDRRIHVGRSTDALAWTDGKSYIAFARHYLEKMVLFDDKKGRPHAGNVMNAALTLLHEACHDGDSLRQKHGPEFHKAYHDISFEFTKGVHHVCSNYVTAEKLGAMKSQFLKSRKKKAALQPRKPSLRQLAARVVHKLKKPRRGENDI
jgi:hypothetical protein